MAEYESEFEFGEFVIDTMLNVVKEFGLESMHVYASADEDGIYGRIHITEPNGITTSYAKTLPTGEEAGR